MVKVAIGTSGKKSHSFDTSALTRHVAVMGATGSGKTVLSKVLVEDCLSRGIPVIAIDPKGDIGSVAVVDDAFDFRPFVSSMRKAQTVAKQYHEAHGSSSPIVSKLKSVKTTIYTPKSTFGKQLALFPDLTAPKKFAKLLADDPSLAADFVEPVSASLISLAGLSGQFAVKAQSFISTLLLEKWKSGQDSSVSSLIADVQDPSLTEVGSLSLDAFISPKERDKLAAALNIIVTSPAKKAWSQGNVLDIASWFKRGTFSVVDIRHSGNQSDKQYAVEQILQELYRYLMSGPASTRLRAVLYIDELAGIFPAPPASNAAKKLLELLLRQARAFGLGIVLATQSPGDIDYKLFGNVGTRFIGKLRTANDLEKVALSSGVTVSELRADVNGLSTGTFIHQDGVSNKTSQFSVRWLYSYHDAPLTSKQIGWIHDSRSHPKREGKLVVSSPKKTVSKKKTAPKKKVKHVSAQQLITSVSTGKNSRASTVSSKKKRVVAKSVTPATKKQLTALSRTLKKHADTVQMRVAVQAAPSYVPHLRVVVEPVAYKGLEFDLVGPYVFDLTAKLIPLGNYLKGMQFRDVVHADFSLVSPKRSVVGAFDYALRDAKHQLKMPLYESTLQSFVSESMDEVEKENLRVLREEARIERAHLNRVYVKEKEIISDKIKGHKKWISTFNSKLRAEKTRRVARRTLGRKNISTGDTTQMKHWKKRVAELKRKIVSLQNMQKRIRLRHEEKLDVLEHRVISRAHKAIKKKVYRPTSSDLRVHVQVLLVPARK